MVSATDWSGKPGAKKKTTDKDEYKPLFGERSAIGEAYTRIFNPEKAGPNRDIKGNEVEQKKPAPGARSLIGEINTRLNSPKYASPNKKFTDYKGDEPFFPGYKEPEQAVPGIKRKKKSTGGGGGSVTKSKATVATVPQPQKKMRGIQSWRTGSGSETGVRYDPGTKPNYGPKTRRPSVHDTKGLKWFRGKD